MYLDFKDSQTNFLMHLRLLRDFWFDNVKNLRQYILRYSVANPTSLRNVAFLWLTSEYIQLASGFMQLAAAGRKRNIAHFHCLFEGNMLIVHLNGDNHIQNFHLWRYIVGYTFGNHVLRLRLRVAVKLSFRPYIRRYTSLNENFEYSYPLNIMSTASEFWQFLYI